MNRTSDPDPGDVIGRWLLDRDTELGCDRNREIAAAEMPADIDDTTRAELECADLCLRVLETLNRQSVGLEELLSANDAASVSREETPQKIGRFEIERELGRGGAGVVLLAFDPHLRRRVALKVPRPEAFLYPEMRERFVREARAVANLNHPHVVPVFEVGEAGPICYIASVFVDGETLSEHLRQHARGIAPHTAAEWVKALAEAVAHAHERGILHRDIKPGNVLLERSNTQTPSTEGTHTEEAITPRLADFGLAKLLDADGDITRTGALLGTPAYMAPEQAEGRQADVDERTDVYALGAVLYELLTGRPPLRGDSDADTLRRVVCDEPVRPRQYRRQLSSDLEAITLKCLAKDVQSRYGSAASLAADLQRFLNHEPVRAKAPTFTDRFVKWSRRHSDVAWVSLVFLMAVTIGSTIAAVAILQLYRESEFHREEARVHLEHAIAAQRSADEHRDALRQEVYSLDMQRAFSALESRDVDEVREILVRHDPLDDTDDIRDWSWYALESLWSHPPEAVLRGHIGAVREVTILPDRKRLLSAGDDGFVRIWDLEMGQLLGGFQVSDSTLNALGVAPDGRRIATGNQLLELWDLSTAERIDLVTVHPTTIEEITFSADGRYLASSSRNEQIHLLDLMDESVKTFQTDNSNESIDFSPDGKRLIGVCKGDEGREVYVWDCDSGEILRRYPTTNVHGANLVLFANQSDRFITAPYGTGQIAIHHFKNGEFAASTALLRDKIVDLAVAPDDSKVAAACDDGLLRFWRLSPDPSTGGGEGMRFDGFNAIEAHKGQVTSFEFLSSSLLVTGGVDGCIKVWNLDLRKGDIQQLREKMRTVAIRPSTGGLVGTTRDGRCIVSEENSERRTVTLDFDQEVHSLVFSADGSCMAIAGMDDRIDLWDPITLRRLETYRHRSAIKCAALSPDARFLGVTGRDGHSAVWCVDTNELLYEKKLSDWGEAVVFSPDSRLMAIGGRVPSTLIIDTATWEVARELASNSFSVAMAFSADSLQLATSHRDAAIRVWDATTGARLSTLRGYEGYATAVAFHPRGNVLVAGTGAAFQLWHLPTERNLGAIWPLSDETTRSIVFSRDDREIMGVFHSRHDSTFTVRTLQTRLPMPSESTQPLIASPATSQCAAKPVTYPAEHEPVRD